LTTARYVCPGAALRANGPQLLFAAGGVLVRGIAQAQPARAAGIAVVERLARIDQAVPQLVAGFDQAVF
jgi:hypothetical protein